MNSIQWLYKYVFRGMGLLFLAIAYSLLWFSCQRAPQETQKQRESRVKAMEQVTGGGSEAIRKYTQGKSAK